MRHQQKIVNLFEKNSISSIRHTFSIANEEDLDQCWDYFHNFHSHSTQSLHTFIALFYEFANQYILQNKGHYFELILETSETHFYLTLRNKKIAALFFDFLKGHDLDYLFNDKKLSVRILKLFNEGPKVEADRQRNEKIIKSLQKNNQQPDPIPPFTFILKEDLEDLLDLCEDMQDIIINAKKHGCTDTLFIRFRSCFSLFSLALRSYTQLSGVATTITNFSAIINTNQERFFQLSMDEISLIEGFIYNIERWLKALFIQGGVALTFMDNSLNADLATIENVILPQKLLVQEAYDLDEIFDF